MSDHTIPPKLSETEFVALLVKYEPALRSFARALLPDWDLVDEALQETSVTVWQKREQLENREGFLPWAKTILRFKCLRQSEKLRSRRAVLSREVLETLAQRDQLRSTDLLSIREKALQKCLELFSSEHRELLLAPHHPNCTVADLAERREKSVNSLYKLLARLRIQLSDCIVSRVAVERGRA